MSYLAGRRLINLNGHTFLWSGSLSTISNRYGLLLLYYHRRRLQNGTDALGEDGEPHYNWFRKVLWPDKEMDYSPSDSELVIEADRFYESNGPAKSLYFVAPSKEYTDGHFLPDPWHCVCRKERTK